IRIAQAAGHRSRNQSCVVGSQMILVERRFTMSRHGVLYHAGFTVGLAGALCCSNPGANAATLQVRPDKPYKTPCAAIAVAAPGDTIEIDEGLYSGDVCAWSTDNLTLRGVNSQLRAHIDADHKNAQGKGIWVPHGSNTVVENIEFSGAKVRDHNGAG